MKKLINILIGLLFVVGGHAQFSPQTKDITEKFFPDPDIEINTPAFQKKRGYTNYEDLMAYLNDLQKAHPEVVKIQFIGESQKGVKIPMVTLNKGITNPLKVWLQGGLHGNEPASTEGILYLMDKLLNDPQYSYLLDRLEVTIVPMANIDGFEKQNRYAANGLDLNRDQTKLLAPESVVLKQAFSDYQPSVAVDFHEYRPYRRDFVKLSTFGVTNIYDVMFLYSGNLNVPNNLRHFTKDVFVEAAGNVLADNQMKSHAYFSESKVLGEIEFHQGSFNSRSSATSYALTNCVASLIEVRGIGIGKTSFTRRVNSTFLVAKSYLETAYNNVDEVRSQIQTAIETQDSVVVSHKREIEERSLQFIDIETSKEITLQVRLKDAWNATPKLQRQSPTAYLILPGNDDIIAKLKTLGIHMTILDAAKSVEVEKYTVVEYQQDAEKYEGVNKQSVTLELATENKAFPTGTMVVDMSQRNSNLAIEVLEPEAPNSFVTFDQIHTNLHEELPVYRYLKQEAL